MKLERQTLKTSQLVMNKGQIDGLPSNPREWTRADLNKLKKSITDTPELLEARGVIVVPDGKGKFVILGGNMRYEAARELGLDVPCIIIPKDTPIEKLKEIVIKDNGAFGAWDYDMLANEWDDLPLTEWGVPAWNTEEEEIVPEAKEDDFDEDTDQVEQRCVLGDVWQLGDHRLMCGDSTSVDDVEKLMRGEKADMMFTDPPYGMKKERDGVLNDNLNYDDLLQFNKEWIPLSFAMLKDNGSWYCWGIDEPLMDIYSHILKPMKQANKISIQNYITWDKGTGLGQNSDDMRSFSIATEKCWFVMMGVQGYNNNADNYNEGFEPIRTYLNAESEKVGGSKIWKEMLGNQMGHHYFTKSQWQLPTKEAYEKMREYAKGKAFKKEYDEIKKEWYATRAFFDNTHDNMNDVWHFARTSQKERGLTGGHATPKPLELCSRGIKSSSRDGEIVLDLFGGSGSTLIACEQLGRKCRMMELAPHYCDVILARWEKMTGKTAVRINN